MKRLNRAKIIEQFEELRQGLRNARDLSLSSNIAFLTSMDAYHSYADKIVVELGGLSTRDNIIPINEIHKLNCNYQG